MLPTAKGLTTLLWIFSSISFAFRAAPRQQQFEYIQDGGQKPLKPKPESPETLNALVDALGVLQGDYFAVWQGIWPTSIDWTSAVMGTYLSSALLTFSASFPVFSSSKAAENLVNKFFSQLTASYFGQDAFALRQEAYDDMLWVVLGWLESIKFINEHSALHYGSNNLNVDEAWYGKEWIPAFAHRARLFWELASQGWDTSLCDGGMIWSPYLTPYKNAITNELYISASISMYLYFPGDDNTSPFGFSSPIFTDAPARPHDPKYLGAAIEGYKWLSSSNMTDAKGLYVDGYHISGWSRGRASNSSNNTKCDSRNEMVYTYNQGVLLSGQRGLYEATGARSYLEDGHKLVSDVIAATGWDLKHSTVLDSDSDWPGRRLGKWQGLGRSGVLEDACDSQGYCSQDGQTFKGIFFHHLTQFCAQLPDHLVLPGEYFLSKGAVNDMPSNPKEVQIWHDKACRSYGPWIKHNANAALTTKNSQGKFGMWWGAPPHSTSDPDADVELPDDAVDYRNFGVPQQWKEKKFRREVNEDNQYLLKHGNEISIRDLNDRGRGRTVETQGGGISVLRALWEVVEKK